jgi:hypothetical protein
MTCTRGIEIVYSQFPDLEQEEWFTGTWEEMAGAYWRAEAGQLDSDAEVVRMWLDRLLPYFEGPPNQDFTSKLYWHLHRSHAMLEGDAAVEDYDSDFLEARDLAVLGYFSTALFVMGRSVERVLHEIGERLGLEGIQFPNGKTLAWEDVGFQQKADALHRVKGRVDEGRILSKPQYHEVSILVHHRNAVAHKEYASVPAEEAQRMLNNASRLLTVLLTRMAALSDVSDDDKIGVLRMET